ncbi:MAG: PEP-CTERM sorting domain-containing protein [Candidatus Hydrogenedentes bacterium]|nr:PEP-CTERM sorting domain-containing protein [Candidatus Hydrogenedentota bacterium]
MTGRSNLEMGPDVLEMDFHASSSWTDTVTNTSGGSLDYDFDFFFSGGTLELGQNGGMAMFSLDILLDGSSIWNRTASLTGSPNGGSVVLDDGGLANTFVQPSPDFVYADFDPFGGNLGLGSYGNGDSFSLTYNLEVWSSSIDQDSYVSARVGDPFGIGFQGNIANPSAPVPEPASMVLMGMGLLGMGARRLRKKS